MYIKSFGFPNEIYHTFSSTILFHVFLVSPLHATCPADHTVSDMITLNMPDGEETYTKHDVLIHSLSYTSYK